ncbi:fumarylacetoacetate hydrolase family protein [Acinetobacter haemolyticus]|uniref:fumarylacetoacetate hydrolase family protein n=2 Tax=Moraxellaceae TaxID=468 RepID=UPI00019AE312|nr:fumarylacetoacetate hydrolase family protein [Acinetobacter haemolyticus]EEH67708.1 FAH family protein [Acinetobacter sp. ATCC 27244]NAR48507.1 fumarylacetoacetate hydrolase family protein [Acinetobacter haemolyticus]NAR57425.1 fumarylacetoacetate hydrolase family protein [Acinetobacter haemolyticus]NAR80146.1 fumarylacetoacetate hydrolase family protein [Acinetobacter haemolyticus]NAR86995.1 fumarylacetoacetate hydrolase family protein [Acinetobacter haemolyticus]
MNTQPSKIVCVGRNYAEHAKELGNAVPDRPILFMKPPSSLATLAQGVAWNQALGECHYECEICLQIAHPLSQEIDKNKALEAIGAITLGLDLTLRDLQSELKNKGQPWERAKAFDGACILADWIEADEIGDLQELELVLMINGEQRQHGFSRDMLFDIGALLVEINQSFSLQAGDVIMTGTPAGVGALNPNDQLTMKLITQSGEYDWDTFVKA